MNIESSFEADAQLGEAGKPSMRALNNPSMPAQSLLAFNTDTGDAGGDATALQIAPASTAVVPLVGMELVGPLARTSIQPANRRDGVQGGFERDRIVPVRAGYRDGQRNTLGIYDEVSFAAELASVSGVRAGFLAPRGLDTLAPSMLARRQSIWSCSRRRPSIATCSLSHTPTACQSRSRRQQVMPLPKPSSWGKSSQGIPVCSTNRMPFNAALSSTERRRPPLADGTNSGINDSSAAHNSLLILLLDMALLHKSGRPRAA